MQLYHKERLKTPTAWWCNLNLHDFLAWHGALTQKHLPLNIQVASLALVQLFPCQCLDACSSAMLFSIFCLWTAEEMHAA